MSTPEKRKEQKEFIFKNVGKLTQVEIAQSLKMSAAMVNQILAGKRYANVETDSDIFNEAEFFRHYSY